MSRDIKSLLARRIRNLRKEYDYSQEELADRAGIDYKHLQRLEGKTPVAARIDTLEKIAKALNISCSELLKFRG
jgi:transcriptional regulator with XRE-family HTH domain